MNAARTAAVVLAFWSGLALAAPASANDLVLFDSIASRKYQTAFARARGEIAPLIPPALIQGYLSKPEGDGPFPAVVLLHSCNGVPGTRAAITEAITALGYVALFVDDFTTRGIRQSCKNSSFGEALQDALGGLTYVAKLPYVDVRRLAVVGFSQGGGTALAIAMDRLPPLAEGLKPPLPRAVVSFYPPCFDIRGRLSVPTLVLMGERDDWAPPAYCDELKRRTSDNVELKLVVYPGAHHAFDNQGLAGGRNVFGHWLQYDASAAAQATAEMRAFLAKHLAN